jgi:hypothetical protein
MTGETRHEQFPAWMVTVSVLHTVAIPALGAYLLAGVGLLVAAAYVAAHLYLEFHQLRTGCRDCFYYGKRCAFGKGLVCAVLTKRGDPQRFAAKTITWRTVAPDFLVTLVPLVTGVVLSVTAFTWPRLAALVALAAVFFVATPFVRGSIACRYCLQKDLGCPAQKLFAGTPTPSHP